MDATTLARLQFGLTIAFHFIFPPLTIGLAWLLVIAEWKGRKDPAWERIGRFFGKLFALTFAVGVATGIVMEFQFGTNWAVYSRFVGDIFGPPLAAEGVFAFFLESTFLGLYLFGRGRVSRNVHWFSILMVAVGATLSAFWIIVANSWQQTPAGFVVRNGRAELTNFAQAVFNPSTLPRYLHTIVASLICGSFFMAGISAYLVRKGKEADAAGRTLKLAVVFGFIVSIMAADPTGHIHARQVARTQPEKFAAMEGLYGSSQSAPLILFAVPTTRPPDLHARIEIPGITSWLAFGSLDAPVRGLKDFPEDEVPQGLDLWLTFVSFHNMVLLGMLFIGVMGIGVLLLVRKRLLRARWFLRILLWTVPLPIFACELGWMTAEVGRQPWIVHKLLRTADAASVTVSSGEILFSLILFFLIYVCLGILWLWLLVRKVKKGPEAAPASEGVA